MEELEEYQKNEQKKLIEERTNRIRIFTLMYLSVIEEPATARQIYKALDKTETGRDVSYITLKKALSEICSNKFSEIESFVSDSSYRQQWHYRYRKQIKENTNV